MTDKLYTLSDLEALRERCAKVADIEYRTQSDLASYHQKAGNLEAMDRRNAAARALDVVAQYIRALPLTTHTEEGTPDWDDLRGVAPDATGDLSSEAFIRKQRDEWGE